MVNVVAPVAKYETPSIVNPVADFRTVVSPDNTIVEERIETIVDTTVVAPLSVAILTRDVRKVKHYREPNEEVSEILMKGHAPPKYVKSALMSTVISCWDSRMTSPRQICLAKAG